MTNRLFIFGLGYSARYLAQKCLGLGWNVSGTVRSSEKAARLRAQGVQAHVFDGGEPSEDLLRDLHDAPHILQSVGLVQGHDPILPTFGPWIGARPRVWVGYLSTTVVYGDHQGAWVDEETIPVPTTDRGKARLAAESAWAQLPVPLHIFRLAGIYGPGRNLLTKILAGKSQTLVKEGQVFSRIHVADIGRLVFASMQHPTAPMGAPAIYNGADDESAPPEDVAAYAASLLGQAPPPLVPYDQAILSPMARSFYADNKRVSNTKMRRLMGPLTHPTYREGLSDLFKTLDETSSHNPSLRASHAGLP